ncbi:MAG: class I SAM-dependent methyltransferase [Promethearchaeota archaeon]
MTSVEDWIKNEGMVIIRQIGIKNGQKILDFGCGSGVYAILASKVLGNTGKVYALDSDEEGLLGELIDKIKKYKIKNIEIIKTSGEISIPLNDESVDAVFIYDIYHLLDELEREMLIRESYRVLRKGGFISYHATHIGGQYNINLEKIHAKMKENGLQLKEKFEKPMFHWAWIEDSLIFNYFKKG